MYLFVVLSTKRRTRDTTNHLAEAKKLDSEAKSLRSDIARLTDRLALVEAAAGLHRSLATVEAVTPSTTPRSRAAPVQADAVAFLKKTPRAGYAELTAHLYGMTNAATMNRARVLVLKMKETNVITGAPGAWKVLRPDVGDGAM